jgi:hypothetical protein
MNTTFLLVYDKYQSFTRIELADESTIDAAVEQYISSGGTRDTLLLLTTVSGAMYKIPASNFSNWIVTTPEIRTASRALDAALRAEEPPEWESAGVLA